MLRILGFGGASLLAFFVLGLALSEGSARADHAEEQAEQPGFQESQEMVSRYWIGIAGGPIPPALRAHLRIGKSEGVLVQAIEEESPAEEGGLKRYDVIVRVNGDPISEMRQLADLVGDQGEMQGQLAVEVIRHGESETVYVTPTKSPVDREMAPPPRRHRSMRGGEGRFGGRLQNQQPYGLGQLPGGVGINISREGNSPAKITVRRGEEVWELDMGDPDSLAQLPEDLRPLLEQGALLGQGGTQQGRGEGPAIGFLKEMLEGGGLGSQFGFGEGEPSGGANDAEMQRRLQEMEQQVEDLRRRFGVPDPNKAPLFVPQNKASQNGAEPEALPETSPEEDSSVLEIPAES